jgi:hypothetical protein
MISPCPCLCVKGAAWVYLLNPEDFLSRLDADRPDSDYEHSDPNTSGSSGIGSLHSEQNAVGQLSTAGTLPRDGPEGEEDDRDSLDFYNEARHVMATLAPPPRILGNNCDNSTWDDPPRRQLAMTSDSCYGAEDRCQPARLKSGGEGSVAQRYGEHVNPSSRYQPTGGQNPRPNGKRFSHHSGVCSAKLCAY